MGLIVTMLERLPRSTESHVELRDMWNRIRESISKPSEFGYCAAAGRLGLDPYDDGSPDLGGLSANMSSKLFNDISDAVDIAEVGDVTSWTKQASVRIAKCPSIEVKA